MAKELYHGERGCVSDTHPWFHRVYTNAAESALRLTMSRRNLQ